MLTVAILFGGKSGEFEVSRCSAASIYKSIDKEKYKTLVIGIDKNGKWYPQKNPKVIKDDTFGEVLELEKSGCWYVNHYDDNSKLVLYDRSSDEELTADVVFPVVHGTNCEDGRLQGLLELSSVPYVGADVIGSAIGMDKDVAKRLLKQADIPVVPWMTIEKHNWKKNKDYYLHDICLEMDFPFFVKPANAGSSVGIHKISKYEDIRDNIDDCFNYDTKILIEKGISCKEIECSVFGNYEFECSIPGEILPNHDFYSYEAKYEDENGANVKIPADITSEMKIEIEKLAINTYKTLCLQGLARVDFFIDKETDEIYINEVNTLPGFTSISMYPKLWEKTGYSYNILIDKLIELAVERFSVRKILKTEK